MKKGPPSPAFGFLSVLAGCFALVHPAAAGVVFSESFEAPVVSGYTENTIPNNNKWIGATAGFGANKRGLYNEAVVWPATQPFSTPFGAQAYHLAYTNSGLTTAVGATGQTLTAGVSYKVSFNAAVTTTTASGGYLVELVAFSATDNNTARADCQSTRPGHVLASASGTVNSSQMAAEASVTFTPSSGNAHLGKDLGIRLVKASNNVLYDNIRLIVGHDLDPSPPSGVTIAGGNVHLSWTNMPAASGGNVLVDVWFGTNPAALTKVLSGGLNVAGITVSAPAANTYYWRVDSYPNGNATETPVVGDRFTFIVTDTDNDGFPDSYELANTVPPSNTSLNPGDDPDADGLTNLLEYQFGTFPNDSDTDNDTLFDGAEISGSAPRPATNPRLADTDTDGLSDGVENNTGVWSGAANTGTSPIDADWDNDGLEDGVETKTGMFVSRVTNTGTDPYLPDTDHDGAGDWYEVAATFTDPNDPAEASGIPYPLPDPVSTDKGNPTKPVKVYILSGQSNMVGIGYVDGGAGSLTTIAKRENKFPNLVNASNAWTKRNDVIYKGVVTATGQGPLTAGQGADSTRVGPELGFGHVMGWYHDEPVLILKASEGNRSLGWDFAPPDTARFDLAGQTYAAYGESPLKWTSGSVPVPINWYAGLQFDQCFRNEADWAPAGASNPSILNAYDVLKNGVLQNLPTADNNLNGRTYQIAGFVWWQGHKDQYDAGHYTRYEANLARLITALRTQFNAPNAPFVVGTIGFDGGSYPLNSPYDYIYKAQKAVGDPVRHPAFSGNVKTVDTTGYWRSTDESPGTQGFHYNNNAETYTLVGDALGRAMLDLLDDPDPPSPNPPIFATLPTPVNSTTVGMVASTATDVSGPVEYWFENTGNGTNSGWGTSTAWQNTGLSNGVVYNFRFKARDSKGNQTGWSAIDSAAPGADTTAPLPNPPGFTSLPASLGEISITMTANLATDVNGVEYQFICTAGGGPDSGWQTGTHFVATGLSPGTAYTYVVRARDLAGNMTAASAGASATTTAPDSSAPTPNPMTFASPPSAQGQTSITMTAATAADPSGVEYFFDCITPGGHDSSWQDSPVYTDTGLAPGTEYTYQVRSRDKSPALNAGAYSLQASATTETPDIIPPTIVTVTPADNATGVSVSGNLVATFAEVINPNTGSITITNLSDSMQTTIGIADSTQIIISGNVLTINPTANLAAGKNYSVRIDAAALEDDSGNPFPGISNDSAWSFETASVQPPTGLVTAGFETSLSPWVPNSVASTGRYNHLTLLQPSDDTTKNFSSSGTGAASVGKAGGELVSPVLDLTGGGASENLTLSLSFVLHNGSTTRRSYVDFSRDGGVNWFTIAMMQLGAAGAASNKTVYSGTVRISEGSSSVTRTGNLDAVNLSGHTPWAGAAFTSNSKLRIRNIGSASADVRLFVDNLAVTTSIAALPSDTVRPALVGISDDRGGSTLDVGTQVVYTVSFSEDISASGVTSADFGNAGTATVSIASVTETSPNSGVFLVRVTPTGAGTLRLQINADSLIEDIAGNDLVTTVPLLDDATLFVNPTDPYALWSGGAAFDADSNHDGIDNGMAWLLGAASPWLHGIGGIPAATSSGGNLVLNFTCLSSPARGSTVLKLQYSADLGNSDAWSLHEAVFPGDEGGTVNSVIFTTRPHNDPRFIHVEATIPAHGALSAGKLFARLIASP